MSVIAGTGEKGYASGPGLESKFNTPMAVAVDSDNIVYVSDMGNQRICKITPMGVVSTLAGGIHRSSPAPNSGAGAAASYNVEEDDKVMFRDGKGPDARFNQPLLACFDKQHNMYISDHYNHRIRCIAPDGTVSTFAGSVMGDHDGKKTGAGGALFDHPVGVVLDHAGQYLYVADQMNHKIKRISMKEDGLVTTFAGTGAPGNQDGTGTAASFNQPGALAIDRSDNLYVSDARNNSIRKITPSGVVSTLAGGRANSQNEHIGCDDGAAEIATFFTPAGLAVDKVGNVYVADCCNHRIRKIATDGMVSTYIGGGPTGMKNGSFVEGDGAQARFNGPMSVAIDPKNEYLFVCDAFNHRVSANSVSICHWL